MVVNASSDALIKVVTAVLLPVLLLMLWSAPAAAREAVDLAGRTVILPAEPRRVVSLAPSITELVYALGRQELLKGVVQYSDHPPEARELPRVGSYVNPDTERIVALRPDLVLAIRDGNPIRTVERLTAMGIPVFAVDPRTLDDIMQTITVLGEVLNAAPRAAALVGDMSERIERVKEAVAAAPSRPSVLFQVDAPPIVGVGEATFLHELILLAGGRNAISAAAPYPRLGWEDVLRLQPEVAVVSSMAGGQAPQELLNSWQRWSQLRAVRDGRVHVVEADLFNRPTHRLVSGLELLARLIHPGLFPAGPQ